MLARQGRGTTFRLRADEAVGTGVRRVAFEQITKAIDDIDGGEPGRPETIHHVRKACKRMRSVARLVRGALGEATYQFENQWFRDSARLLSADRDGDVAVQVFNTLIGAAGDKIDNAVRAEVRRYLVAAGSGARGDGGRDARLREVVERLREALDRIPAWSLSKPGFTALRGGLTETYRRGRTLMLKAGDGTDPERFHSWRKQVGHHRYHSWLLREMWPVLHDTELGDVETLTEILGEHHDLEILQAYLRAAPGEPGGSSNMVLFGALIHRRRSALEKQALALGHQVYALPPTAFSNRMQEAWDTWRIEPQAGQDAAAPDSADVQPIEPRSSTA